MLITALSFPSYENWDLPLNLLDIQFFYIYKMGERILSLANSVLYQIEINYVKILSEYLSQKRKEEREGLPWWYNG